MKRLALILSFVLIGAAGFAQELPMPSPMSTVEQRVGLTDVKIAYSRPGVKGRQIFGDLVPYDKLWRTGANKATQFTISHDVTINGSALKAGTYALFTIPGKEEWTVVFNKDTEQWGSYEYDEAQDALRVKAKAYEADKRETMQFYFDQVKDESAALVFHWAQTTFTMMIKVENEEQAMANIESAIAEADRAYRTYNSVSRYYLDRGMESEKALELAKKSVHLNKKYWNLTTLSRAQAANGLTKEAIATAEEAMGLAKEAESDRYAKMNEDNIAEWKAKK